MLVFSCHTDERYSKEQVDPLLTYEINKLCTSVIFTFQTFRYGTYTRLIGFHRSYIIINLVNIKMKKLEVKSV